MPDIKSVLSTFERTIQDNERAGNSSNMYLSNLAKNPYAGKISMTAVRRVPARRSLVNTANLSCSTHSSSSHGRRSIPKQAPNPTKRLDDHVERSVRKSRTTTDGTVTTASLSDNSKSSRQAADFEEDPFHDSVLSFELDGSSSESEEESSYQRSIASLSNSLQSHTNDNHHIVDLRPTLTRSTSLRRLKKVPSKRNLALEDNVRPSLKRETPSIQAKSDVRRSRTRDGPDHQSSSKIRSSRSSTRASDERCRRDCSTTRGESRHRRRDRSTDAEPRRRRERSTDGEPRRSRDRSKVGEPRRRRDRSRDCGEARPRRDRSTDGGARPSRRDRSSDAGERLRSVSRRATRQEPNRRRLLD